MASTRLCSAALRKAGEAHRWVARYNQTCCQTLDTSFIPNKFLNTGVTLKIIMVALCFLQTTACASAKLATASPVVVIETTTRIDVDQIATPTPSPLYERWTAQQVIDAFEMADLAVGEYRKNDPLDLVGAPSLAVEFIRFFDPSRGQDAGGVVFSFKAQADFDAVYKYHKDLGWYDSGLYYPWVFSKDNILLQINGILGKPEAQKYADVLGNMR